MIKIVCWNIHKTKKPLTELAGMEDVDVALLQEVGPGMAKKLPSGLVTGSPKRWDSRQWSTLKFDRWPMVVKMSDRVEVEWFDQIGADAEPSATEIALSAIGLLAVARIIPKDPNDGKPFIVASMYARWRRKTRSTLSVKYIENDLSKFMDRDDIEHPILLAGDFNKWYKWGAYDDVIQRYKPIRCRKDVFGYKYRVYEEGERYTVIAYRPNGEYYLIRRKRWKTRRGALRWIGNHIKRSADTRCKIALGKAKPEPVFWDQMESLGLEFLGPQHPNGNQADPIPSFLPSDTKNVVTYKHPIQTLEQANQQLDYVFATRGFHNRVSTRALNRVEEWGSSDHCRILIDVAPR